jgi:hypothetical protein
LFTIGYKRLTERRHEAFRWGRVFDGGFLAEGKLLKGKELLKWNC